MHHKAYKMTEELKSEGTTDKPSILFNRNSGTISIKGRSLPEDAFTFYKPVIEWLSEYAASPATETSVTFNFEYFNTASAKQIYKILNILTELAQKSKISISWHYDEGDTDMLTSGERFSKLCGVPIRLVQN